MHQNSINPFDPLRFLDTIGSEDWDLIYATHLNETQNNTPEPILFGVQQESVIDLTSPPQSPHFNSCESGILSLDMDSSPPNGFLNELIGEPFLNEMYDGDIVMADSVLDVNGNSVVLPENETPGTISYGSSIENVVTASDLLQTMDAFPSPTPSLIRFELFCEEKGARHRKEIPCNPSPRIIGKARKFTVSGNSQCILIFKVIPKGKTNDFQYESFSRAPILSSKELTVKELEVTSPHLVKMRNYLSIEFDGNNGLCFLQVWNNPNKSGMETTEFEFSVTVEVDKKQYKLHSFTFQIRGHSFESEKRKENFYPKTWSPIVLNGLSANLQ